MKKPEISIIVPVYNSALYLRDCLNSIKRQSYKNFEVICVNDGSTDMCPVMLNSYSVQDNRFRVINQENRGPGGARNTGINVARGKYIFFVDGDDVLHSQVLEKFLFLAKKTKADVVCGNYIATNNPTAVAETTEQYPYYVSQKPIEMFTAPRPQIPVTVWNKLFKKEVFNEHRFISDIYYEDIPLTLCLFSDIKSCAVTKMPTYFYRNNNISIMRSAPNLKKAKDYITAVSAIYKYFCRKNRRKELDLIFKNYIARAHRLVLYSVKDSEYYQKYIADGLKFFSNQGLLPYRPENVTNHTNIADIVQSLQ